LVFIFFSHEQQRMELSHPFAPFALNMP